MRGIGILIGAALLFYPAISLAQAAIKHFVWENGGTFQPLSRTAEAITGPLTLRRNEVEFANTKPIHLEPLGRFWRDWDVATDGDKQTADLFMLSGDPGMLLNGNSLCGAGEHVRYMAIFEQTLFGTDMLNIAIFRDGSVPTDKNSPGLCGTFAYYVE
jgi:hypothetical protein